MNIYYQAENGEYKALNEVKDVDLTVDDDSEILISPEPVEITAETAEFDLSVIIPQGYRNAEILKRDGYLSPKNGDFRC